MIYRSCHACLRDVARRGAGFAVRGLLVLVCVLLARPVVAQQLERLPGLGMQGPASPRIAMAGPGGQAAAAGRVMPVAARQDPLGTIIAPEELPAPPLPPAPGEETAPPLPSLQEELYNHGGSYLYCPEGDKLGWPGPCHTGHYQVLRLPEDFQAPEPITAFAPFEGTGPIEYYPRLHWLGGYDWEPRFVAAGGYQIFGLTQEFNGQETALVGHQLLIDLDFRLTGTERFHVQFRPLGEGNTGGSYYQFTDPEGYVSNDAGVPQRYWFEAEFASLFGGWLNPFAVRDYHLTVGKFPFALQNNLLINDEILGVIVGKNTIRCGTISNMNVQLVCGLYDVDAYMPPADARMYGVNTQIDWRMMRFDASYFYVHNTLDSRRDAHYTALSASRLLGPWNYGVRGLCKFGDEGGTGDGQLLVFELNRVQDFHDNWCGIEQGVWYATAFGATKGWQPISGGNYDRLRASFEANPLVAISAGRPPAETAGCALGVQLFRHHKDESWIPEIAFETPQGEPVLGFGLRYFRKTGPRSYFEVLGIVNTSDDPTYERRGVYLSETILF